MSEEEIKEALERLEYFEPDDLIECAMYRNCIEKLQNLIDLYNKEKEKNKKYNEKIKAVLELIDTSPYTAYTLYGDILYDDENIREILEDNNHIPHID